MKKTAITASILLGIIIVFVAGGYISIFFIGSPLDGNQVFCETSLKDQTLTLQINTAESAIGFRGWKQNTKGRTLYIDARKVLVSKFAESGTYSTVVDVENIDKVILGGKIIWERIYGRDG